MQEIGFPGTIIFLGYMLAVFSLIRRGRFWQRRTSAVEGNSEITGLARGVWLWFLVSLLYAFASYGLSSYEWYLLGGLSLALARKHKQGEGTNEVASPRR